MEGFAELDQLSFVDIDALVLMGFPLRSNVVCVFEPSQIKNKNESVNSSVTTSVSVDDMVQTDVPLSTSVGTQPVSAGTIGTLLR